MSKKSQWTALRRFRDLARQVYVPGDTEHELRFQLAGDIYRIAKRRHVSYHEELDRVHFVIEWLAIEAGEM